MSFVDKFLNVMRLNDDDDDDYEFDNDDYMDEEINSPREKREKKDSRKKSSPTQWERHEAKSETPAAQVKEKPVKTAPKITPISKGSRKQGTGMEVCVIKPTSVEDAREITETLLSNRTVVLNVEGLNIDIAQRIIDFTSGSCFAISGNLQKISNYIFIITPANVDISGDFQSIMDSFDVSEYTV